MPRPQAQAMSVQPVSCLSAQVVCVCGEPPKVLQRERKKGGRKARKKEKWKKAHVSHCSPSQVSKVWYLGAKEKEPPP